MAFKTADGSPAKEGKTYVFHSIHGTELNPYAFRAVNGMIVMEDLVTGHCWVLTLHEFAQRCDVMLEILRMNLHIHAEFRNRDSNFKEDAKKCMREGMAQGDPFDPDWIRERLLHKRQKTLFMGNGQLVTSRLLHDDDPGYADVSHLLPPLPRAPQDKPFVTDTEPPLFMPN
jgi:hypothetical protein